MRAPPLLPLTAIAIGGVLTLAALRNIDAVPKVMQAMTARAEGSGAPPAKPPATAKPATSPAAALDSMAAKLGRATLELACWDRSASNSRSNCAAVSSSSATVLRATSTAF
jgi:hypothetical protein